MLRKDDSFWPSTLYFASVQSHWNWHTSCPGAGLVSEGSQESQMCDLLRFLSTVVICLGALVIFIE